MARKLKVYRRRHRKHNHKEWLKKFAHISRLCSELARKGVISFHECMRRKGKV